MTSKLSVQLFKQLYSCLVQERKNIALILIITHLNHTWKVGLGEKLNFIKLLFIATHVFQKYLKIILKTVNSKTCLAPSQEIFNLHSQLNPHDL